ncbi:leucine--tRNA ligase [Folsomia candida]|uniref:leucine--tRNA ligase n=1 Tax=Folsomia candida TaxID=158441 RepID=UPI000B90701F|nr:leucine--tRNA ligase [Folsomia candida]
MKVWKINLVNRKWVQLTGIKLFTTSRVISGKWKNFSLDDELTPEIKKSIEKKWHSRVYGVDCQAENKKEINKPNPHSLRYVLPMFPYPSGRLHLGHVRVYTLSDVLARFHRMQGHTVIHPMGWDAYGLPAENAARDHGIDAEKWTRDNINHMKTQIIDMGCCFDWEREFATCDPSYFKWTQWIFLKLWEKGLAYKKRAFVYWDPVDKTVLAEEQVDSNMRSWRSGAKVEKKLLHQWFIKTAVFAEKLSQGLTSGDLKHGWRDVVALQDHWIGEIKGFFTDCVIDIKEYVQEDDSTKVSTKEPLRLWFSDLEALKKATFVILSPSHFLLKEVNSIAKEYPDGYKLMKFKINNPLTGTPLAVFTATQEATPWIPESCDCRINESLCPIEYPLSAEGGDIFLNNIANLQRSLPVEDTKPGEITQQFQYYPASLKLRDWLVSRQRSWGTPIPAANCIDCGQASMIHENKLPMTRSSVLDSCTHCGSCNIQLETDTLDTFMDSSFYFFRFLDPKNDDSIFDPKAVRSLPVHTYIGGKEHATLHLYYARFITQFLHHIGLSPVTEPFQKLIPIGMVLGEAYIIKGSGKYLAKAECVQDGKKYTSNKTGEAVFTKWEKMSKSKYNGIDPDNILNEHGIDTTRLLTMAEAAPTSPRKWPPNNIEAFTNWQKKVWLLLRQFVDSKDFGEIAFIDEEVWQKSEAEIFDTRNYYLKGINHDYSDTSQISVVISKLQAMMGQLRKVPKLYMKESIEFERALGTGIICMYPIMPAYAAQLWQSFRDVATFSEPEFNVDHEVWEQPWPSVDFRYHLDLICKIKGEEIVTKVERTYLDSMDPTTALQIVLDLPEVQKLVSSGHIEIVRFHVEPGYRATIVIKEKNLPTDPDNYNGTTIVSDRSRNKQI